MCLCDGHWWEKFLQTPGVLLAHPNKQPTFIKQAEWTPVRAFFLLPADWGGHNTSLTFSLLFPVFIFLLQLQGIELIYFLIHSVTDSSMFCGQCHNHKDNWEQLERGMKEESWRSSAHEFIIIPWRICQLEDVAGFFWIPPPFALALHHPPNLCVKATDLVHLSQVGLGVLFDSRYF